MEMTKSIRCVAQVTVKHHTYILVLKNWVKTSAVGRQKQASKETDRQPEPEGNSDRRLCSEKEGPVGITRG